MRGHVDGQQAMFVAFNIEEKIPLDHPLRSIKLRCDAILKGMSRDFNACYGHTGRVSIPPESLIKALLVRALFAIPSERRLCEACSFNILYRWFIDWPIEESMWTPEAFSMNRERFERHDLINKFFQHIVSEGIADGLVDDDRFCVDGTLIRSLAGHKSIQPLKQDTHDDDHDDDINGWSSFKGQKRFNKTHRSVVDPDARLASKGGSAHLSHALHVMTDASTGLCVSVSVDTADGRSERRNALMMLDRVRARHRLVPKKLAADAGYASGEYLSQVEARGITPHSAMPRMKINGQSALHRARKRMRRRTRTGSYRESQKLRKCIEPVIGWCKHVGGLSRTRFIGHERIQDDAMLVASAWNLMRMTKLAGSG